MKSKQDILDSIELRQSTIKDWLFCSRMFHLKHIEGLQENYRHSAMVHGSVIHKIIDIFHKGFWHIDLRTAYLEIFEMIGAESDVPVYYKEDLARLVDNAIELLEGYRNKPINREAEVLYSEVPFRVKIAGHWFTGTIDQVRVNQDGTIELLDLKTSKQRPSVAFLHNDWQLNLYTYALYYGELYEEGQWLSRKLRPTYSSWYFLRSHEIRKRTTVNGKAGQQKGEPLIRSEKGIEDLRRFREDMKALLKVMLKDWSFPNPQNCGMCSFAKICMDKNPLSSKLVEQAQELLEETWS
jgi:RecB family exonuclease